MNTLGKQLKVTIFGQSHAPAIGAVMDGLPAGMRIDEGKIAAFMGRRAPGQNDLSTARREADAPRVLSGLNDQGYTCGAPLCAVIENGNAHSRDYENLKIHPRPGHADFTAYLQSGEYHDVRGGGQFSGRLTAPLCFAGAVCMQYLEEKGVRVAAHISRLAGVDDGPMNWTHPALPLYAEGAFPTIDAEAGKRMQAAIRTARQEGDSVGGVIEVCAVGVPGGLGGPMFDGVENRLSAALFGIPAVRGVEFGAGFAAADMRGSCHNDAFVMRDGHVATETNRHGGALGGISTGMPVIVRLAIKPTPSVFMPQRTVNLKTGEEELFSIAGRHDPCIVPRAVPVAEAVTAITLMDMILEAGIWN